MSNLLSLPESWLRLFAGSLPPHLKRTLRCCCQQLRQAVDEVSGVALLPKSCHVPSEAMLQLVAPHLTRLNTLQLQLSGFAANQHSALLLAPGNTCQAAFAHHIRVKQQRQSLFPVLKKLAVNVVQQPDLAAAIFSTRPPQLTHLRLCDRHQGAEVSAEMLQERCSGLLQQLPVLAPSITWLELDFRTYRLLHKLVHTALSNQSWPQLNTLILHPKLSRGHAADCGPVISPATWAAVFEPLLVQLTRLDFGSRECVPAAGSDGGGEGGGDRQQAEGGSSRKASPPPAAASEAEAAGEAGSGLVHLKCSGLDSPWDNDAWCLNWLGSRHCRNLTALEISLCSAGELDFDVLAQLKHLVTLSLHHFEDECVTAAQLAPLSACCCLTQLRMEALIVERPAQLTAAALGAQAAAQAATQAAAEFVPTNIVESAGGSAPLSTTAATHVRTAAQAEAVFVGPSMVGPPPPRLTSLQRLTAGLLCKAPLSCWVPNLTRLSDLDYDLGALDLPLHFVPESPEPDNAALVGLTGLQVLGCNIFALVRHAAHPQNLHSLRELHVEMVGSMEGSCIEPGGLLMLPQLTRLVMTINNQEHRNLTRTYTTTEDYLLWRNQSSVQLLRLKGSVLLGGFLVEEELLQKLPTAMPQLQRIEVVKAPDVTVDHLRGLVCAGLCRHVVVQGCRGISERDCVQLQEEAGNGVAVDYCM